MFNGYLELGGNEIVNSSRAWGYTHSADCPINWLVCDPCPGLREALDESSYTMSNISDAPWYDSADEATARFYGVHALTIENMTDSTRTATIAEGITDGGVVGMVRNAVRMVRVRAILSAHGEDALEAGMSWLDAALQVEECSTHGSSCGSADLCFFVACPPERALFEGDEIAFQRRVDALGRKLHGVTCVSGPTVEQKIQRGEAFGYIVEFILAAATPWVFSETRLLDLPQAAITVIQDVPFNLARVPSAEYTTPEYIEVARNYSLNPSAETNVTGWDRVADGVIITTAMLSTVAQSTELKAAGTYSAKMTFTATTTASAQTAAWFGIQQEVTLPTGGATDRYRYSINMWGSANNQTGSATLGNLELTAYWRAGGSTIRTDVIGTMPSTGGALSAQSILPPAGATSVIVRMRQYMTDWTTGDVVRFYVDALAVTVP